MFCNEHAVQSDKKTLGNPSATWTVSRKVNYFCLSARIETNKKINKPFRIVQKCFFFFYTQNDGSVDHIAKKMTRCQIRVAVTRKRDGIVKYSRVTQSVEKTFSLHKTFHEKIDFTTWPRQIYITLFHST